MRKRVLLAAALCALALSACGGGHEDQLDLVPPRFGPAPQYRPDALSQQVAGANPVGSLRCQAGARPRMGVHLEIFVTRLEVVTPAGIGIAPPHRREGAYVNGGRCSYPV